MKIHQIWMAPTKAAAEEAFDLFVATYQAKYPKAVACLEEGSRCAADVLRLPR